MKSFMKKHSSLSLALSTFALACYLRLFSRLRRYHGFHAQEAVVACIRRGGTKLVSVPEFYDPRNKCTHNFRKRVAFFHVGKGGGGTVTEELNRHRLGLAISHPKPGSSAIEALRKGPMATLIINVRDPVDRFVSAFRWRLVVLCRPDDKRAHNKKGKKRAVEYPHEVCKTTAALREEERMLREKYRSDPNAMAEALCEDSEVRAEAMEDYSRNLHSMSLAGPGSWLEFLEQEEKISSKGIQNFIAIPMEKLGNGNASLLEQHTGRLVLHLLQTRYGKGMAEELIERAPRDVAAKSKETFVHSGASYLESTNSTIPQSLSPRGECCLARHFEKDYQLIKTMLGDYGDDGEDERLAAIKPLSHAHPVIREACSWGSEEQQELCRSDLRSMLSRRARYLDRSLGSCSQAIGTADSNE